MMKIFKAIVHLILVILMTLGAIEICAYVWEKPTWIGFLGLLIFIIYVIFLGGLLNWLEAKLNVNLHNGNGNGNGRNNRKNGRR